MLLTKTLITVVDDDRSMSRMLSRALNSAGLDVAWFGSAEEFLDSETSKESACLILDMNLPGMSGAELQSKLIRQGNTIPIIFISADANEETQQRVLDAGAAAFLSKPFRLESLLAKVRAAAILMLV